MSKPTKIAVLGGGAWGTALAAVLSRDGKPVTQWARDSDTVDAINNTHHNPKYLPDIKLPENLKATTRLDELANASIVLAVTPVQTLHALCKDLASWPTTHNRTLVLCAKGFDRSSGKLLHDLAGDALPNWSIAALSGPSFAADVARNLPTAVTLAAHDLEQALSLSDQLSTATLRLYASDDLTGVEAGGALKNVLALAVGIARGLNLGASAEAALTTRGFAELARITTALGGKSQTVSGLSGLGDLMLTCSSPQSRNFAYGMALANQKNLKNMPLAEGVHTASTALALAHEHAIDAPIIEAVVDVLEGRLKPADAVRHLLARPLKSEI